ncbi:hypothetical protein PAXINDRAFT_14838 [Paxillus involutus ATCC 200175]|uniref:Unplaced genomic scaffold PAXINscaffold_43, whole genome shotgun sequence n=1 Tax=Paxillus involutus ATCC 200175 TaxID=664439 RepID=A0A0C9TXL8_PAXIN|nr:hypothetical protein PAXINDRAFT_14838 [Paxillus involutus ATCC 200175]
MNYATQAKLNGALTAASTWSLLKRLTPTGKKKNGGDDGQTADLESPRNIDIPDSGDDSDTFRPEKTLERDDSGDEDEEEEEPEDEDIEDELSDRGNGKQKAKKKNGKQRTLHNNVAMVHKHSAAKGSHASGKQKETMMNELSDDERPTSKRQKGSYASNLSKDWKKKMNQLQSTGTSSKTNPSHPGPTNTIHAQLSDSVHMSSTDEIPEDVDDLPPYSTAKPGHSRSSSYSSTTHYTGFSTREQSTVSGEFDHDETDDQVTAARKTRGSVGNRVGSGAKGNPHTQLEAVNSELKGRERTTKLMGMLAESKDVDTAVEETRSVGKVKALKHLKATDLPIGDTNHDRTQWEQLVRGVINWAGTLDDPFGTNEHPELFSTVQELWDLLFKDRPLNVQDHPAIKKLVIDRLNNWRSEMGKRGLKYLERYFSTGKDSQYRNDVSARAAFVKSQLPQFLNGRANLKGSWESSLVIAVLSYHISRVGQLLFQRHSPPSGALATATASVERALTIYKSGESAKENDAVGSDTATMDKRKHSRKYEFDQNWAVVTRRYAKSTSMLPKRKWDQIVALANISVLADHERNTERTAGSIGEDELLMEARGDIPVSDSDENE